MYKLVQTVNSVFTVSFWNTECTTPLPHLNRRWVIQNLRKKIQNTEFTTPLPHLCPRKIFNWDFIIFYEKTSAISSFATSVIFRSFLRSVIFWNVFAENQFLAQLFKILKNFKISFLSQIFEKSKKILKNFFFSNCFSQIRTWACSRTCLILASPIVENFKIFPVVKKDHLYLTIFICSCSRTYSTSERFQNHKLSVISKCDK